VKNLVIVESPAKAKTIEKYLKRGYDVVASFGHVRDLPKSSFGVDIKNNFEPRYSTVKARRELIKNLKKKAQTCSKVFLATDPDREGEAIAWHLAHILKLDLEAENRVVFNEITADGIKSGIAGQRKINLCLVNAQQARRILDRIVGYKITPLLWRRIRRGLSAGRVQSVAVKIIVERERQIREFVSEEYWSIEAFLASKGKPFSAKLSTYQDKKLTIDSEEKANAILADLKDADFVVIEIKKGTKKRAAPFPFTTSTLQQDAYNKFSFTAKRTMKVAQELYEGVGTEEFGTQGLITYMRTDSLRVSDSAKSAASEYIINTYGKNYLGYEKKIKKAANVQDAHEAIRPTDVNILPAKIKKDLTADQHKLYKLIWERFVASRMADMILDTVTVKIKALNYGFVANGHSVKFDGFSAIYTNFEKEDADAKMLPALAENEKLDVKKIEKNQHFTQPPARFTEASLIKALEEKGIGRPSTYAPTISTIFAREYIEREGKTLKPTGLGEIVDGVLAEYFGEIVNENFTAKMESELDLIGTNDLDMVTVLQKFYDSFSVALDFAENNMDFGKITIPEEKTDEVCSECGANMIVKFGRFGKFLSCERYPDCSNKKKYVKPTGGICSKCGKRIVIKKSKTRRIYYGCEDNPKCDFMTWNQPITDPCPKCGATLFRTKGKNSKTLCMADKCDYEKSI
jgi:DNA topoisomerase-1